VRERIVKTKQRFPAFGLRKVRDFLHRFDGLKVSASGVRRTLDAAGMREPVPVRRKRKIPSVRSFERAKPGELWQTDITSFLLTRHSQRVYAGWASQAATDEGRRECGDGPAERPEEALETGPGAGEGERDPEESRRSPEGSAGQPGREARS